MKTFSRTILSLLFAASLWTATPANLQAQQTPAEAQQVSPGGDPIRDLNLSPEQRERIRAIREETRGERAAINQRLRETNWALEEVLDSDNPSEAVVEKHLRDVAEAQAASLRMRIATEMKVRRVLTPDQLTTLRTLRQNARNLRRERQLENNEM
ncbi:MAG TPA: Spy/CpxP family protein refolding chaperone, partial [Pyrinomonadaceae bacterium]|nr:Spy/CpxP family protein refolding chaperone [Pyrinomonadaceae bacterium]